MTLKTQLLVSDNNAPFAKTLPIKVKRLVMMWRNKMCREWRTETEINIEGLN